MAGHEQDCDCGQCKCLEDESCKVCRPETKQQVPPHDTINAPSHYTAGGIECIDYLRAKLSPDEFRGFLRGNALKYLSRLGRKGDEHNAVCDAQKAVWYAERLVRELEGEAT